MPAKKDSSLHDKHYTAAERTLRESVEGAVQPKTPLRETPPQQLRGHRTAWSTWKRLWSLYHSAETVLVTSYDEDILVTYCLLIEETYDDMPALRDDIKDSIKTVKDSLKAVEDMELNFKYVQELTKLYEKLKAIDARLDSKRKDLHKLQQSLYLTPRTRAGVAPTEKEPDHDPSDPMAGLVLSR